MLLTAKELATALDVHITTIRRAYRTKRIPYERLYKLYFFDLEKVQILLQKPEREYHLLVRRGSSTFEVELRTKELL